ncbi:MAG: peptidylprolyl isomerase [Acidobacteria bacterium]|jgi:peptidyl-prolyl cis-trans isomerase SurA|nr:peptidylprolyl isomerase [Acidobacteriota bacterium]
MSIRFVSACALALVVAACGSTPPAPAPDVWAVVNGAEIKRDRVERYYRSMVAASQNTPSEEEAIGAKLGLVDELITDELVIARATELKIVPTTEEIDKAIAERRGSLSDADFAKQLEARKTTADEFRAEVTREVTKAKVIEQDVTAKVTVTDEEVTAYYEKNRAQFNVPERQYHLAQIVVSAVPTQVNNQQNDDARSPGEAQRKLAMLAERLKAGENFAALAANFSEDPASAQNGGDLGLVSQSQVDSAAPALKNAVMNMKPGDLNTITNGPTTTMLALVRRLEPGQRELSDPEVKDGIKNALQERRLQLMQGAYLARLRDEATIVNYLARQIVDAAAKVPDVAAVR